ncbi:DUF2232 domain-containing protein, partial [Staphylococcus epidermidis]|uniref:DUF2232 domain-containing protein n=1 Tax=Staphylococcus epidermidis TaxID=1282 RepID=UPI0011A2CC01
SNCTHILEETFRQITLQLPTFLIIVIFIFLLINLIITFPILPKFKLPTPIFKPLCTSQITPNLLSFYLILL